MCMPCEHSCKVRVPATPAPLFAAKMLPISVLWEAFTAFLGLRALPRAPGSNPHCSVLLKTEDSISAPLGAIPALTPPHPTPF